jgi:small-conductance mechanosensitive channel
MSASARYSIGAAIRYIGVILAVVLAIAMLGMDMTNLALVAGALSVGIGFGLQNIVNNFVSGMILLIERPIKVGDWVIVGTNEGLVKRINIRATELETFQLASVIIPNAEILSQALTNWTLSNHYGRVEVPVGVAYGTNPKKVHDLLLQCAREHPLVISWMEPFVVFQSFGPARLEFELRCFTADVMQRIIIASELRFAIQRCFAAEGIEIPLPQQVVHWTGDPPSALNKNLSET